MVTVAQKEALRRRLEAERQRLRGEIAALAAQLPEYDGSPNDSHYGNHVADEATDTLEEEKALALQAHLQGMLGEVEAALERMETGEYGICENCREPIAIERLEAIPWARYCLRCKSAQERAR